MSASRIAAFAPRMLTAIDAAHWYLENVAEDDVNRESRWRALRELLAECQDRADNVGLEPDAIGYEIIMAQDSSPWTVMLMPPDWIAPHPAEPFLCHVMAGDRSAAFEAAISAANKAFAMEGTDPDERWAIASDWALLLICEGHVKNLVDEGG